MKTTTKYQSFLAASSKKYFKLGLLFAIAFTIAAFKLPLYSKKAIIKFPEPEFGDVEYVNTNYINAKEVKKLPKTTPVTNTTVVKIISAKNDPPELTIPKIKYTNSEDFSTLGEEPIIDEPLLPKVTPPNIVEFADVMPAFIGGEWGRKCAFQIY